MRDMQAFHSTLLGETYYLTRHESGLPVYVFPKEMSTSYALLAVNYGSAQNAADEKGTPAFPEGIAHFLEHKLFSNEDGVDSFERFSAFGADANAYTTHTHTVYLFSATERFYDSLGELVDFVTHPYFTDADVEKEQGIIAEEIRMCKDSPYDTCYYQMLEGLYHKHPVKTEICGSVRSIRRITAQTLYDCYHAAYRPENMILVVCGDVTPEEVMKTVDARISGEKQSSALPPVKVKEPKTVHRRRVESRGQVAKPIFSIGVKDIDLPQDPGERNKRDAGMDILIDMLFDASGELYNRLIDKDLVTPGFSSNYFSTADFGFLELSGEADDPEAVLAEITSYLEEVKAKGLKEEDFERCRRVEFAEYIKGFDSTEEIAHNILSFVFEDAELFAYADVLRGIGFDDVCRLFEAFFAPDRFTMSVVRPQK